VSGIEKEGDEFNQALGALTLQAVIFVSKFLSSFITIFPKEFQRDSQC